MIIAEAEPYAAITADGHRLIGGETVTFGGRSFQRFRKAVVASVDGPMVWLRMGKTTALVPAGWLEVRL